MRIEDHELFLRQLADLSKSHPAITAHINGLKHQLEREGIIGHRIAKEGNRYAVKVASGTLTIKVWVEYLYFKDEDKIQFIDIFVPYDQEP